MDNSRPNIASPTVGFIGLGLMGAPMCRNLLASGFSIIVHNRSPQKAEALGAAGARVADSPGDVARSCDIVMACLDTHAASESVFLGEAGVVAHARPGTLLIDHSTIAPELAQRVARVARERALDFLDAPVSGGPEGATNGTLAIMVGGRAASFERALPVMRSYGRVIRLMGDVGSGTNAKLVNQLLTFVHGAVAAEAIALAQRTGLDLDALMEVLRASFGQSRMLDRTVARVQRAEYDAGAMLAHYDKDLTSVASVGSSYDIALPMTAAARATLASAIAQGLGARDLAALRLQYPDDHAPTHRS
jgi:3-hydroxyisobutyrate dehydrogenase-like beta-hydroxyacid dehydrogenase